MTRCRCCQAHARQLTVMLNGEEKRLCQQCSSFHPLTAFDGTKRCAPMTSDHVQNAVQSAEAISSNECSWVVWRCAAASQAGPAPVMTGAHHISM